MTPLATMLVERHVNTVFGVEVHVYTLIKIAAVIKLHVDLYLLKKFG